MKISVVICTYNRDKYILKCLLSLKFQLFDKEEFEVIIINNKSTDNTESICLEFQKENPDLNMSYFLEENQGLSFARNRGVSESKGDIIAFIDDDAFADKSYLSNLVAFFESTPDALAIGGKIIPLFENTPPNWLSTYLLPLFASLNLGQDVKKFPGKRFPVGANMAFKREVFSKVGLFNTDLGRKGGNLMGSEEKDMIYRIRKYNNEIYYLPTACVEHIIPETRLSDIYIKRQAIGVGVSERVRVTKEGYSSIIIKIGEELFKTGATLLLLVYFLIHLSPAKGWMLLKFRYYVWKGIIFGEKTII